MWGKELKKVEVKWNVWKSKLRGIERDDRIKRVGDENKGQEKREKEWIKLRVVRKRIRLEWKEDKRIKKSLDSFGEYVMKRNVRKRERNRGRIRMRVGEKEK